MTKITMLGTGHAMVTECYNTCFIIENENGCLLVDCGGGNGILKQMKRAGKSWDDISAIFITHAHSDHITGAVWALRAMGGRFRREDAPEITVFANAECIAVIDAMARGMLSSIGKPYDFAGARIHLKTLEDGEHFTAIGRDFTAFSIGSTGKLQFGFTCEYEPGKKLVCLGDESYHDVSFSYAKDADWLMHEAFTAEQGRGPGHHGSARRAGANAKMLGAKNLIIYHTEDGDLAHRKAVYSKIAGEEFDGGVYVPDDIETITL